MDDARPGPLPSGPHSDELAEEIVRVGDLVVNRARREAMIGKRQLSLRPKEFDLLYYLASHPNVVHSRKVLLQRVWGYDYPIDTRTVDVHVRWLRQKIEQDPQYPARIETVRGFGYKAVSRADYSGRDDIGTGPLGIVGNVIWLVLAGWWLALGHLITAVLLAVTIIGIPFAWAHLKLAGLALWPIGKMIVPAQDAALPYARR